MQLQVVQHAGTETQQEIQVNKIHRWADGQHRPIRNLRLHFSAIFHILMENVVKWLIRLVDLRVQTATRNACTKLVDKHTWSQVMV